MPRDSNILINKETNQEYINVPIEIAAKYLDVSKKFIYDGLKQKILPFGTAVKTEKSWIFNIPAERLKKYKDGADMNVTTALLNNVLPLLQKISRN